MARSKSSARWLQEHFNDPFVKQSQQEGYRSRASYKLLEIDTKEHLLNPGMHVIDLGCAPGGWTQVLSQKVGASGCIIASDLLPMEPIEHVHFVQGDFTEQTVLDQIMNKVLGRSFDLVISDMAPNMSGINTADQAQAMYLCELAFALSGEVLAKRGNFLVKAFQGEGFDDFVKMVRHRFTKVITRKPQASRARSREVYLLARGFKG